MKKILLFFLVAIILICASSCQKTQEFVNPWEDPSLSESDAMIRKISDAAIMQEYGLEAKDIYLYSIQINTNNQGGIIVYYKLCFYGYDTLEHYWVNLSPDYTLQKVTGSEIGAYSSFISSISEDAVKNAEKALDEKLSLYEEVSEKFLSVDEGGNLCLTVEVIKNIDPPIPNEYGDTQGCGIDHEHLLISETVCKSK